MGRGLGWAAVATAAEATAEVGTAEAAKVVVATAVVAMVHAHIAFSAPLPGGPLTRFCAVPRVLLMVVLSFDPPHPLSAPFPRAPTLHSPPYRMVP